MTKIAREYGTGNLQTAYEYGYNGDGVKVLGRRYLTAQHRLEFRFIGCGAGCAGNSLSLYAREYTSGRNTVWRRAEEYVNAPTALMYGVPMDANVPVGLVLFPMVNGYVVHSADGQMVMPYYTDSSGMKVGGYPLPACAEKRDWEAGCVPYPVVPNPEIPYPYEPGESMRDKDIEKCLKKCVGKKGEEFLKCMAVCLGVSKGKKYCEDNYCKFVPPEPHCKKGNPCKVPDPDVADCQHCCDIKYFCCLIFNPPGTSGAAGCETSFKNCLIECDITALEVAK